jgi:hypothetical protein
MAVTQVQTRQIATGAITNNEVNSAAAILTSKLADAANFILRGGSVAFNANQSMGGNLLTNVGTPSTGTDAANKSYVDTQISNLNSLFDSKGSARAASTANVTVSNPGTAVFDGVTLATNDRLLLKNQTAPAENGLYVFNTSGTALVRVTDMDAWTEVPGAFVVVEEGTVAADTLWLCTSNAGGTLGTTAITWVQTNTGGYSASNFVTRETPSGSVNGANTTFTLANTPTAGSEEVFLNGMLQEPGGNDYTISTATITMATAPLTGERLRVNYRK